jgi:two-component system, NarL family, sensor histidine kinase DevS
MIEDVTSPLPCSPVDDQPGGARAVDCSPVSQLVELCVEVSRTSGRLRLLLQANEAVAEELALPALHCRVTEAASHLVQARTVALVVLAADGTVRQLLQRGPADAGAVSVLLSSAANAQLAARLLPLTPGRPVRVAGPADQLPPPWSGPCLAVPVHFRREVLAVLLLDEAEGRLADEDADVLLGLAGAAGTAIENARLYEEARRRQEWLQEAVELGNAMLALTDQREALALVTQSVQKLADAELVTTWLPGTEHDLLVGVVGQGDETEQLLGCQVDRADTLADEILSTGRGIRLDSRERPDCSWMAAVDRAGVGPVMVLPLVGDGGTKGLLLAGRRHGRTAYTDTELDMAETFASHMALALGRIRAREDQQRLRVLEDRERIARDLHDHVIQSLFATGMKVQSAARLGGAAARPRLAEAVQDIDATIRRLRTTIFGLADSPTDAAGLRSAVLAVLAEVEPVLSCRPQVDFVGPVDTATDPALVEEVLAVLREAATNSGKYARATQLLVRLQVGDGVLRVTVQDDGVGIDPASSRRSGLANLRHRAAVRGGDLVVDVPAGGGTRLCWSVPLPG